MCSSVKCRHLLESTWVVAKPLLTVKLLMVTWIWPWLIMFIMASAAVFIGMTGMERAPLSVDSWPSHSIWEKTNAVTLKGNKAQSLNALEVPHLPWWPWRPASYLKMLWDQFHSVRCDCQKCVHWTWSQSQPFSEKNKHKCSKIFPMPKTSFYITVLYQFKKFIKVSLALRCGNMLAWSPIKNELGM